MKLIKQLNSGQEGGGSTGSVNESFDILSADLELDLLTNNQSVPEKKKEDEKTYDDEGNEILIDPVKKLEDEMAAAAANKTKLGEEETPKYTPEELTAIEKFTPEQKADFEAGKIDIKGEPVEEGFKGEGATPAGDEESTWIDVAKELGYPELKDNSFDAFKEAQKLHLEQVKKEIDNKDFEKHIADLPAKEQLIVRGIKSGLTIEQIEKPIKTLDGLIALTNTDLVAADLKARGLDEDVVQFKIDKLVEEEKLDIAAKAIRDELVTKKSTIETDLLEQVKNIELKLQEDKNNALKEDFKSFRTALDTIPELMGTKLSSKNKDEVAAAYEKGEYHDLFKDPKKVAEFIIWDKYKKEAQANLVNKALEDKRRAQQNSVHNIPPIKPGAGSSVSKMQKSSNGKKTELEEVMSAELDE